MSEEANILIARRQAAATTPSGSSGSSSGALPDDLLIESSRRLKWLGLIYAGTYFLAYFPEFFINLVASPDYAFPDYKLSFAAACFSILMGVALAVIASRKRISPRGLLKIGLVFEVAGALGIALTQQYGLVHLIVTQKLEIYSGLSWTCLWILIFPTLIPVKPRTIAIFATLAVLMDPLVFYASWIAMDSFGMLMEKGGYQHVLFFLPQAICVGIAWFSSRIFYKLGRDVSRARELGSYRLIELIGRGGMGEVWRAKHKLLVRPAAVKLIRPESLAPGRGGGVTLIRRFEREAQATSFLGSPHAVDLYDFGITPDGTFYYVMELLNGLDMETLVSRYGPLPAARVIHLIRQACHALGDAHANGLIHRDVKAANLFLCHVGPDFDHTKVLDFGLVKVERSMEGDLTKLTADGVTAGTPAYMPPESVGGSEKLDERGDLYSLGCVAYWLLTGETVFKGTTPMETVLKHVQETPVAPSLRSELSISASLDRVILDCLAKSPGDRPQTADELSRRLAACDEAGGWTQEHAREWWEKHLPAMIRPGRGQVEAATDEQI